MIANETTIHQSSIHLIANPGWPGLLNLWRIQQSLFLCGIRYFVLWRQNFTGTCVISVNGGQIAIRCIEVGLIVVRKILNFFFSRNNKNDYINILLSAIVSSDKFIMYFKILIWYDFLHKQLTSRDQSMQRKRIMISLHLCYA